MRTNSLATTEPPFHSTRLLVALAIAAALAGCNWIGVASAPSKKPVKERTAKAVQADSLFWRTAVTSAGQGVEAELSHGIPNRDLPDARQPS